MIFLLKHSLFQKTQSLVEEVSSKDRGRGYLLFHESQYIDKLLYITWIKNTSSDLPKEKASSERTGYL